jgi:hypothetical protein
VPYICPSPQDRAVDITAVGAVHPCHLEDGTEAICIAVGDGHPYRLVSSNHERAAAMTGLAERVKERSGASSARSSFLILARSEA